MSQAETAGSGNIPTIHVSGANLPEAWEKALLALWEKGVRVRTEYDRKDASGNFTTPPSLDSTMVIEVEDPFAEPRIHKNFPGGPEELEIYRQEVVEGIHDHWVSPEDPDKWTYTYHGRLFRYAPTENLEDRCAARLSETDQMEAIVRKAVERPYSRRMQAVTWMPTADPKTEDPPCLQRLWYRLLPDREGTLVLNLNSHWRSRDAYKAWFMNAYALTDLQKRMGEEISKRMKRPIRVGRYVDISDSFHIYGRYFAEVEPEIKKMKADLDYTKRAWRSDHPAFLAMTEEVRERLRQDVDFMKKTRQR